MGFLHPSSKALRPAPRRVLHFLFGLWELPLGLPSARTV